VYVLVTLAFLAVGVCFTPARRIERLEDPGCRSGSCRRPRWR
jgi:hypothetical protein